MPLYRKTLDCNFLQVGYNRYLESSRMLCTSTNHPKVEKSTGSKIQRRHWNIGKTLDLIREHKSAIRDLFHCHSDLKVKNRIVCVHAHWVASQIMQSKYTCSFALLDTLMEQTRQVAQELQIQQGYHGQHIDSSNNENGLGQLSRSQFLQRYCCPNRPNKDRRRVVLVLHSGRHDGVTQACCSELARMGSDVVILGVGTDAAEAELIQARHLVER